MGKIIRNGVEYSGAVEAATAVNYDNSLSGLEAQTVQEGLDEVSNSLGGLEFAIVDGKPHWKERGADSFSPFNSGEGYNTNYYRGTITQEGTLPLDIKCGFKPRCVQVYHKWANNSCTCTLLIGNDEIVVDSRVSSWGLNQKSGITIRDDGFYMTGISQDQATITYICL